MTKYLPDATNFDGLPKLERPSKDHNMPYQCPKCKGHGRWNLRLDAYGPGKHFQAHCGQCNGWGWVSEEDRDCVHKYEEISQAECREKGIMHWGRCWHAYQCGKCGRVTGRDSSD